MTQSDTCLNKSIINPGWVNYECRFKFSNVPTLTSKLSHKFKILVLHHYMMMASQSVINVARKCNALECRSTSTSSEYLLKFSTLTTDHNTNIASQWKIITFLESAGAISNDKLVHTNNGR